MVPGRTVWSFDNQRIGAVDEVGENGFCLRMRDGKRCWIRWDAIYLADEFSVTLICYASGLNRWLV